MNKRSTILAGAFGVIIFFGLIQRVVYPRWIEPALTIDQRIVVRLGDLKKLERLADRVKQAKVEYRDLVTRNGSFEAGKIETEVRARINQLIEKHHLEDMNVTRSKPARVGKTDLKRMRIVVKAVCSLESAVGFMRDVAELPQLIRMENVRIYPAGASRRVRHTKRVNLTVPLDVWILPQRKILGRIDDSKLEPPAKLVRHADRDYSVIWEGKLFSEYVPPVPLVARAGQPVNVRPKRRVTLTGGAAGGEAPYTFLWTPSERLNSPNKAKTKVDTNEPMDQTYQLLVTDVNGKTAIAIVRVTVKAPPPKVAIANPPKPIKKPRAVVDPRWKGRKSMQLRMALLRSYGNERLDEVMVYDKARKTSTYYTVGDEFDGGSLVFVHPTGGVVRRQGNYFLYPIGAKLDSDLRADEERAGEYPRLRFVADRMRKADEAEALRIKVEKDEADAAAKAAKEAAAADKSHEAAAERKAGVKTKDGAAKPTAAKKSGGQDGKPNKSVRPRPAGAKKASPGAVRRGSGGSKSSLRRGRAGAKRSASPGAKAGTSPRVPKSVAKTPKGKSATDSKDANKSKKTTGKTKKTKKP